MLRSSFLKVVRTLKHLFGQLFRFPQTLATRKINAYALAQRRTAMEKDTHKQQDLSHLATKEINENGFSILKDFFSQKELGVFE